MLVLEGGQIPGWYNPVDDRCTAGLVLEGGQIPGWYNCPLFDRPHARVLEGGQIPGWYNSPMRNSMTRPGPRRWTESRLVQFEKLIELLFVGPRRWTDSRLVQSARSVPVLRSCPRRWTDSRLVQWVPCKTAFHLLECRFVIARKQAAHTSERLVYTEYRRFQSVVRTPFRTFVAVFAPLSQ